MRRIFSPLFKRRRAQESAEEAAYLRTYECFRQILAINDSSLQLIADIDDRLLGQGPFNLEPLFQRIRKAVMEIFLMINNLNEIAGGRFLRLHDALGRLQLELEAEIGEQRPTQPAGYVVPLFSLRASDAWLAGSKMANPALLDIACREVQHAIHSAPIPQPVRGAIEAAYHELAGDQEALVAMRSSAVGENASFAGKYHTELNVTRGLLEDSYRTVLASMFSADAILYRFERGLNDGRKELAVGCIRMVEPRASGIMFSRAFDDVTADRIVISS